MSLIGNLFSKPSSTPVPASTSVISQASEGELTHVTEEMYKKNFELAEKNKTLSVLQKIDEIILSSATDIVEIAKAVTKVLVDDAEFKIAGIFLDGNNKLSPVAIYITEGTYTANIEDLRKIKTIADIQSTNKNNILMASLLTGEIKQTKRLYDLLNHDPAIAKEFVERIQQSANIQTTFVYPLIVRTQAIGVMFISLTESLEELSDFEKDLLSRLHSIIGIAMDNALLYNQVQESNKKLQALDKMKDEFVSLASHELRTPMTAIKSYIWMALDGRGGELSEKLKYYLTRAFLSTNRLINLVNDMLNISRIESGRLTVHMQSVDIYKLSQEVAEEVMPRATELGLTVTIEQPAKPLPPVLADADKIKEVLINLIGNSIKFTQKGGFIKVSLSQKDAMVEVKVVDNGNGIDPTDIPKLFQKFAMLEGSYTANQPIQGTGLGLYICKALITLHGGTIAAASEGHGKGATFTFTLREFREEDVAKFSSAGNESTVGLVHSQV